MQTRSFVVACLALGLTACEGRSPVAPVPQSTTPAPPAAPSNPFLTGVVRDSSGSPVAGAEITFWPLIGAPLISNEKGQFELQENHYIEVVYASKPGYEGAITDIGLGAIELTLHDIIRIPAGQSARVTVGPGDSLGGYGLRHRVRYIHVFSNGDRIVRLHLVADDGGPVDFRLPQLCGDVCAPNSPSTFFVEGGGERYVQILIPAASTVSRAFTLITSAEEP